MGVMWKQVLVGTPRMGYPVVKAVKPDSVGQNAGLEPFEILLVLNGQSVTELTYEQVIDQLKSTRPLTLEFKKVRSVFRDTSFCFCCCVVAGFPACSSADRSITVVCRCCRINLG